MKNNHKDPLKKLSGILAPAVVAISFFQNPLAHAGPFITGDIAVLQENDGSVATSTAASPVFVLEFLPSTANQSGPVQTISIPTSGASRLTQSSGSSSEGFITRSTDGSILTFVGYDSPVGIANVPGTVNGASGTNRYVGVLDMNGNFTRTAGSTTDYSGSNIRSSVSDGVNFWTSGTASPTTTEGIWYSAGGAAPIQITTPTLVNTRVTRIFNGKLYYTTQTALSGYSGLQTTAAAATATGITAGSAYDFAINPAGNVAYVADDSALGTSATSGGIAKWTNNGSAWARAFTFGNTSATATNGLTAGCRGLAVDFSGPHPVIYATTADTPTKVITITDTSSQTATSDNADQATVLAVAPNNIAYRGVALGTAGGAGNSAPSIAYISPSSLSANAGSTATFTLIGGLGYPTAVSYWYQVVGSVTNPVAGNGTSLTLSNLAATNAGGYFAVLSNSVGSVTSSVANLTVLFKPTISAITPASITTNAGSKVTFTLTSTTGTPPATNMWYKVSGGITNPITGATNTSLTLNNVLHGDSAGYFAILTNSSGSATSSVATLTVTNDPNIVYGPASAYGLLGGTVQFTVGTAATSPTFQWYFSDTNGNITAPVPAGTQPSGSSASGTTSSTLMISNLKASDSTNFVVVVQNAYGSCTSSVATLFSVSDSALIAFWNFNQPAFPNLLTAPPSWFGAGTTAITNCSAESGQPDPSDDTPLSYIPMSGLGTTNYSWAMYNFPLNNSTNSLLASNKQCGAEFFVSTVGARNIGIYFDSRVTQTASYYERLQFTTNGGTSWIDYPASSSFNDNVGSGDTGFYGFSFDLTGFPNVDNNPNFGFRFVEEFQSTATYGISPNNNYLGAGPPEPYGFGGTSFSAGTLTFDLVGITGDAITNSTPPPTISSISDISGYDYVATNVSFTVTDGATSPDSLIYSATALDSGTTTLYGITLPTGETPFGIDPGFVFGGSGMNRTLTITPNTIPDEVDACPILITVTDPNTGASASTSFLLTLQSVNLAPTNTLTSLPATNVMANGSITIPFMVSDDRTPVAGLTDYAVSSDNTTLIPNGNIMISGAGTANPSLIITPAANQIGVAVINVALNDDDAQEARTTTASIAVTVLPNTNVVAIDYFDYNNSGPLETVGSNFWTHLSGNARTLQYVSPTDMPLYGNGYAVVDTPDFTENLQAGLLGAPYPTNGATVPVLYMSFLANMSTLPNNNGSYFMVFNDGSGNTADIECRVMAATNGAAPGYYRLGIANTAANATNAVMFPMDLSPNSNYTVVASLVLATGQSTLWVNPMSASSQSVTDTSSVANLYNISDVELRQSGANAGIVRVQKLKVGTTFDSVLPSLHLQVAGSNVIVTSSDPTLAIQAATNALGPYVDVSASTPYTNAIGANSETFYRFKR